MIFVVHHQSGDEFAAEMLNGHIVRAAGPLHHSDKRDEEALRSWLNNSADAQEDGKWLDAECIAGRAA